MLNDLATVYQIIIASEPLLIEAADLCGPDEWEIELRQFYVKHLEDERHHAKWLREDLADHPINLHFGSAQVAGMAYYLIRHIHPVALLGYMLALEGRAIPIEYVEAVEAAHGKSAARTLRLHAEEDPHHMDELKAVFVPDEWKPLVENTRIQTLALLEAM